MTQATPRSPTPRSRRFRLDESSRHLVARLWRDWMRRYIRRITATVIAMVVVAGSTALYPFIIQRAVDAMQAKDARTLLFMPLAIIIVTMVKGSASFAQAVLSQSVAFRVIADMQKAMFSHLMRSDLAAFQSAPTGQLISRFTNDVALMRDALSKAMTGIARDAVIVVVMIGAMFWLDWVLAIIVLVFFPISAIPITRIGRRLRRTSNTVQEAMGGLTSGLGQAFSGARLIKAYRLEDRQRQHANERFENIYRLMMKMVRGRARTYPFMETLGGLAVASVVAYGGFRIVNGSGTLGEFTGFLSAVMIAYQPVRSIGNLNAALQEGLAAVNRTFDLIDTPPSIVDALDAKPLLVTDGVIELDAVTFDYQSGTHALDGISLTVPAGATVALVGPSGAGKSTILNLIPRFYDVTAGQVMIDGQDVRNVTLDSLRDQLALVSQDVTLFNDTVRANIAFGRPNATEAQIAAAARDAAAEEFIAALPNGYDTIVGDDGGNLSGGQRQRIAIARAMLRDAPILLLDEATSALDAESERHVQTALAKLTEGRTTIVIAHRLSTVMDADIIIVMDHGAVVETGTHAELFARGGLYARLCRLQFHKDPAALADDSGDGPSPNKSRAGHKVRA